MEPNNAKIDYHPGRAFSLDPEQSIPNYGCPGSMRYVKGNWLPDVCVSVIRCYPVCYNVD